MKKVLVTGGAGLIGIGFARKLLKNGYSVVSFDLSERFQQRSRTIDKMFETGNLTIFEGTILDKMQLQSALQECYAVVHLAAMLGVKRTESARLKCLEVNVSGTENVLNAAALNRVCRVMVASSSEVYGEPIKNPIKETDITQGKTVYAVSKLAAEELTRGYQQIFPWMNYTILRFFNTYGEGQVAQFVISRFVKNVLEGRNPVVYGDGNQTRGYGHIDDIASAMVEILESEVTYNKTYNLGNSLQVFSLKELAEKVIEVLAPDSNLKVDVMGTFEGSDRTEDREIFSRWCDTTQAQIDFGFSPDITVEEGIRRIAKHGPIPSDWPKEGRK